MHNTDETLFPEDIVANGPRATIARTMAPSPAEVRALDALKGDRDALELRHTLGEGGMGLVRLGIQNRLGRQVAVKTLRPDAKQEIAVSLLQEAWVTGSLEHPNIVPIYDVTMDADALPQIVLKRIEGTSWTDLLDDEAALDPQHREDPVAWHLSVLVSVCNAVEFAHSKGFIHRDLKPDNIMIGRFGEVYLLDWGIAVSLDDTSDGRFPLARDQHFPTGTPIYMAPEMATIDGSLLEPRTDVFLLGGLLFRVLAGRPPRVGESIYDVLATVNEPIALDDSWPEDLRGLLGEAFALDPADRPSAARFREALQLHLSRRPALKLLDNAERGIAELEALLDRTEPPDRIDVYDRFGAARFGLQEVLNQWPNHVRGREALRRLLLRMARYELDHDDPRAAQVLLAKVDDVPDPVLDRLEALQITLANDRERLARFTAEADASTGAWTRIAVLAGLAMIWVGSPALLPLVGVEPGYPRALFVAVVQFLGTAVAFAATFHTLFRTQANRTLMSLLLLEPTMNFLLLNAGRQWGLDIDQATVLELFLATTLVTVGAFLIDRRLLFSAVLFAVAAAFTTANPEWIRLVSGPIIITLILNTMVVWGRLQRE